MKINGVTNHIWQAADHEGEVLKSIVTKKQDRMVTLNP